MKILLVSATENEIEPLLKKIIVNQKSSKILKNCKFKKHDVDVLITGIGMVSTVYYCTKILSEEYDFAINAGIAGSFKKEIKPGEIVHVISDRFSELGAEDGQKFLSMKEINLKGIDEIKNDSSIKNPVLKKLKKVSGITVNTVHGRESSIKKIVKKINPDIETMEGAAFLFACKNENIPCAQIRAISNFVERRNKKNWNIPLAIKNLNEKTFQILNGF